MSGLLLGIIVFVAMTIVQYRIVPKYIQIPLFLIITVLFLFAVIALLLFVVIAAENPLSHRIGFTLIALCILAYYLYFCKQYFGKK